MSFLASQIKNYIASYNDTSSTPSLADFIWSNIHLFLDHDFKTKDSMRKALRSSFTVELEKQNFKLAEASAKESMVAIDFAFNYNKKITKEQRSSIVTMYFALEEDKDVEDIKEKTRPDFEEVKALNSTHPSTQLDKMAIDLLERFSSLSHSETIVLKLALSHIVSFFDNEHLALYMNYIKNDQMWSLWENKKKKQMGIEEEKKKIVEDVFGAVVKEAKQSLDHALKFVLKEQLDLLDKNERKTFKYQMLEAASYLLHNVEDWESDYQPSEAEVVSRVSGLIRIFFNDSNLKIKVGETTADCIKANRVHSKSQFSGGNSSSYFSSYSESATASNVSGRKIDMKLMAANGIEVALCEFKRNMDRRKLAEQQGKCCRLNVALLEDLKTININDRIIAMTWGGCQGRLTAIEEGAGDVYIAYPLGNVEIPTNRMLLDNVLVQSMITLCQWKTYLVGLSNKVKVNNIRFGPIMKARGEFAALFTPKQQSRKRQRSSS